MKLTMLMVILVLLVSCSTTTVVKKPISTTFMTTDQIREEFEALSDEKTQMHEQLSKEALERIKDLKEDVLSPEDHQFLKKQKSIKREEKSQTFKGHVDRRECDNEATRQCGGVCTSHGVTNAMDNTVCKPKKLNSSNMDLWNKYKKYSTSTGLRAASKNFICEEKYYKNCGKYTSACGKNRHIKLLEYKSLGRDIEAGKIALDKGHALTYAGKVTASWANCDKVMNPRGRALKGGHAVAIVGYKDEPTILGGGYFIILNSWGKRCGDSGYQYLPYQYLKRTDGGMYGYNWEMLKVQYKDSGIIPDPVDPIDPVKPICRKVRYCKRRFPKFWRWNCWYKTVCNK